MARRRSTSTRADRLGGDRSPSRRPNRRRRRQRPASRSSLPLAAVFLVLVGINIYVFFFRGGTSIQDLMKASALSKGTPAASKPRASREPRAEGAPPRRAEGTPPPRRAAEATSGMWSVRGSMKGHLGLSTALTAHGVRGAEAAELVEALRPALDMRTLQPRHAFEIVFDGPRPAPRVARLIYRLSRSSKLIVARGEDGALTLQREPPPVAPR